MQEVPQLGKLAPENGRRDAVHVAIAPVVARHVLEPGEHVGLHPDTNEAVTPSEWPGAPEITTVGIVDPFLRQTVHPGERFWLFLYPGTVTSLRHVWVHHAFKPKVPGLKEAAP